MTKILKIREITLEGPDLSGKTRLYNDLHRMSNFKWNIQDRAENSMMVYSRMYERGDDEVWLERIRSKLLNLNHRYVMLLPDVDLLIERFNTRGDEVQDASSILEVHRRFTEAAEMFSSYPTCIVVNVTKENQGDVKNLVLDALATVESADSRFIQKEAVDIAIAQDNEAVGLQFEVDVSDFEDYDLSVLEYEKEREYYRRIRSTLCDTIRKELNGENPYRTPQNPVTSRRFVYADPACISYINCQLRNKDLTVHVVLRSSDVEDILYYDLCFLQILSRDVREILQETCDINRVIMKVRIDSAHVVRSR